MRTNLFAYAVTLAVLLGIDFIWLSRMGDVVYRPVMGDIALPGFRLAPGLLFYVIYVFGVVYFAVSPALEGGGVSVALLNGAIFGFCAYATYDLTNQATLKNWSTLLTAIDMGWGTTLTAISAVLGYLIVGATAGRS